LDEDIATQSVPFLSNTFHQLESVAFWGKSGGKLLSLNTIIIDDDQRFYVYTLLDWFSGAFSCRTLPQNLQIVGLSCPNTTVDVDGSCQTCKRVCSKFPLERTGDIDLCLPFATCNEIIQSREGGRDYLQSETRLMQLLGKSHVSSSHNDFYIIGHDYEVLSELTRMVESSQVDVKKLNSDVMVKAIKKRHPNNISVYYLSEDSFDYLKTTIGIPISNDLLDPDAIRLENLDRMSKHIIEETDSLQKSMGQMRSLLRKSQLARQGQDPPIQRVVESGVLPKLVELLQRDDEYEIQLPASDILVNVAAGTSEHAEPIVQLGAIPSLVHLLRSSQSKIPFYAAWVLGNITTGNVPNLRELVLQAGVMPPLLKILEDHQTFDVNSVRYYVWVLHNLCRRRPHPDFKKVSPSLHIFVELIHHYSDEEVVRYACVALSWLSDSNASAVIGALKDTGICRLIELLEQSNEDYVRRHVLRILGNIASGSDSQTQIVIDNNVLPCLLNLLSSTNEAILNYACWTIANITAGTVEQIQAVIDASIIQKLIPMLSDGPLLQQMDSEELSSPSMEEAVKCIRMRAASVVTTCTLNSNSKQVNYLVNQGCIPPLLDLKETDFHMPRLRSHAKSNIQKALQVLEAHHNSGGKDDEGAVLDTLNDTGVCRLVKLLDLPSSNVQADALKTVGKIASGNESQTQIIIDNGALPSLLTLLSSSNKDILIDACWAISNITAGTVEQIQAVIDSDVIPQVISLLKEGSLAVRKEAAWVIGNATQKGSLEHVKYLVNQGCIPPLLDLLTVVQDDTKIVTIVLESLKNASQVSTEEMPMEMESHIKYILDANNGRSMLQELQHHDDDVVRQLSTRIVEMHFSSE